MTESLWDFALHCYRRPGVADYCLALQDRCGADVNLLLAAAWLAAQGRRWSADDLYALTASTAEWREQGVLPLRAVRRYLQRNDAGAALYEQAKALELAAERVQLQIIEHALHERAPAAEAGSPLAANLQLYAGSAGFGSAPELAALIAALGA